MSCRSRAGFTFLELILVTALMAFAMLMAAVRMDYIVPKYRLRGATREVGALMKLAKSRAVSTGRDVFVEYDLPNGKYWVLAPFEKEEDQEKSEEELPPAQRQYEYQKVFERELPVGVSFVDVIILRDQKKEDGKATIRISPFGSSEEHIVNLKTEDGNSAVKLNGFTGALSFYGEYTEPGEVLEDHE
jgi:type II secretory pathway pseudopilin PulG